MTDFFADLDAQPRAPHGRAPSRARGAPRPTLVAVSLALVAGAAVALAVALGGGGSRGEPAGTGRVVPVSGRRAVAVLNGTTTPGLAKRVGTLLADEGFRVMLVTNARTPDV